MRGLTRQWILGVAVALTLVMNALAGTGRLFGRDPASISDSLPNAFTPAGFTFSVWGVIFVGLVAFALWQGRADGRGERLDRLGWPFLLANLLNVGWLLAWHSLHLGLSVAVMLALLASLIWLYLELDRLQLRGAEQLWLGLPVSLYLAWISVATMANVTAWLVSLGVRQSLWGVGAQVWSGALLGLAGALGAFLLWHKRDWGFGAVLGWAFYGVYAARPDADFVLRVSLLAAGAVVVGGLAGLRRRALA